MIRPTIASDVPILVEIARGTGVFKPHEIVALDEVLVDSLKKPGGEGYHACTAEVDGRVLGFEIHGLNPMTDRTWDLYWIAVATDAHGQGVGTELLQFAEEDIRRHAGRLIIVETSTLPTYRNTRQFYLRHGYEQVAIVADFYADGDSQALFRKRV